MVDDVSCNEFIAFEVEIELRGSGGQCIVAYPKVCAAHHDAVYGIVREHNLAVTRDSAT